MSDATRARSEQMRTPPGRLAPAAFAAFWAASVCFHLGSYGIWNKSLWVGFAAVWLLANPGSTPRLLLLAAAVGTDMWLHLPEIPNHWIVHGGVAAAALLAYGCVAWQRRYSGGLSRGSDTKAYVNSVLHTDYPPPSPSPLPGGEGSTIAICQ